MVGVMVGFGVGMEVAVRVAVQGLCCGRVGVVGGRGGRSRDRGHSRRRSKGLVMVGSRGRGQGRDRGLSKDRRSINKGTRRCNRYDLGLANLFQLILVRAVWWVFFLLFLGVSFSFFFPSSENV